METTVNERIKILLESRFGGNKSAMARVAGVSSTAIADMTEGRKGAPSLGVLQNLLKHFSDINPGWLIMGEGPMLKGQQPEGAGLNSGAATIAHAQELASNGLLREIIDTQKETITDLRGMVATLKEELGKLFGSSDAAYLGHSLAGVAAGS